MTNTIDIKPTNIKATKGEVKEGLYIYARKQFDSVVVKSVLNGVRLVIKYPDSQHFDFMFSGEKTGDMFKLRFAE